jgi:hypothetical protein
VAHTPIDVTTHLLLALYPAAAIFLIEAAARLAKIASWRKYMMQGFASIGFAIAYFVIIDAAGIAIMLLLLAPALFVHARRVKNNPTIR